MLQENDTEYKLKEVNRMIVESLQESGYKYTAKYVEKYGYLEPLWEAPCIFESHLKEREELAKRCLDAGKTATELGIVKKYKHRPGVII